MTWFTDRTEVFTWPIEYPRFTAVIVAAVVGVIAFALNYIPFIGSVIATVPIMVLFLGLERFMTKGLTAGSVKG